MAVRELVTGNLDWIRRQQVRIRRASRERRIALIDGETHFYLGKPYVLKVVESEGRPGVALLSGSRIEMRLRPETTFEKRQAVLNGWYRSEFKELLPDLAARWEERIGEKASEWRIRRMRTRWGSCNTGARRIWLSLALVKKPVRCIEYVIVHELVHLLERKHNARFYAHMDEFMPDWRERRTELNGQSRAPDAHQA
jgi:predicted metal-dependent hydrolase